MKNRLLELREKLQTSIWFIPAILCSACLLLAISMHRFEHELNYSILPQGFDALAMSVTSARSVLGIVAGSVLSVGGVVFSMTMVALTLTSGQYGPKILRQFLTDRESKISLGMFLGTSLYCLVVMAGYEDGDQPGISVGLALLLTVFALGTFIRFIHRTATDLQADQIVARIGGELHQTLEKLTSRESLQGRSSDTLAWRRQARGKRPALVAARETGYVQTIDYPAVLQWCIEHNCVAQLRARAGDFLLQGTCLLKLYGCAQDVSDGELGTLCAHIRSGPMRTPVQDPEFPITQLNQLAARALSPGINDPGTAITCIDWYSMALATIVDRELPGKVFLDESGTAILLARYTDFPGMSKALYAPARQFAHANIPVLIALLESTIRLAELTTRKDRLRQMWLQGRHLVDTVERDAHLDYDLRGIRQRYSKLCQLTSRLDNV